MRIFHSERFIEGPGFRFRAAHPVLEAHLVGNRVLVVYDYMAFERGAPARNLYCYALTGEELWRAEDIGMGPTDAYTNVVREEPVWVGNFAGFDCRIDLANGRVAEKRFTK
jgi:hypothetical protein